MRRQLPPLGTLRAFEAVAQLGSVTKAADVLGRTHGAVSRQLRQLAEAVGTPLFDKDGVGIKLNDDGRAFLSEVTKALDHLEVAFQELAAEQAAPTVTVAVSPSFAMLWLAPRLRSFYTRHPNISIYLLMASRLGPGVELEIAPAMAKRIDVKLSWDRLTSDHARFGDAEVLAPAAYGLVCAPDYPVRTWDGGGHAPTLIVHYLMGIDAWRIWRERYGVDLTHDAETTAPHAYLALGSAAAGVGAALLERRLAQADLDEGRLIAPFGFFAEPDGLVALVDSRRRSAEPIRLFLAWLKEEANATV